MLLRTANLPDANHFNYTVGNSVLLYAQNKKILKGKKMKMHKLVASLAAVVSMSFAGLALAQVSKDGMGKVLPVELYACSYNDGQDAGDLGKVIDRWTKFMDDNNINNYAAWTLSPYFYGPDQDFDVIWMGAYSDGNAMGAGTDMWLADGGEIGEAFSEVMDCNGHIMLSSSMYKAPASEETPTSGIITMMDCELNEGKRYSDIKSAEIKWAEYLTGNGSTAGYWHWSPTFGGGDSEFDYKVVFSYTDFAALGADYEHGANGGGREASQGIFDDIDDCDDARVYIATSVRNAQLR